MVLLSHDTVFLFTDFKGDSFFNGTMITLFLDHTSQKEGVSLRDDNTLYITDEYTHDDGGNLYEFRF